MAYKCRECGNDTEFREVFNVAVDVVDSKGLFIRTELRDVAYYVCCECDAQIAYRDFVPLAAAPSPRH
jgi:hypothetical protein